MEIENINVFKKKEENIKCLRAANIVREGQRHGGIESTTVKQKKNRY